MTGEHDARGSYEMEGSNQHWTSSEDGLLLGIVKHMKAGIQNVLLEFRQQNLTLGINSAFVRWLTLVRESKNISCTAIFNVGYSALTKTPGQRTQR
jgi:hypothetical protein